MRTERLIALLIGAIAGLLLSCSCIALFLATASSGDATVVEATAPATLAPIQADLSEDFLNRTFLSNVATFGSPVPITAGRLDIMPGNRIAFTADLDTPLGPLQATGTVTIAVQDNLLDIGIESVTLGQLPVTQLMRLFRPNTEAEINAIANRQLSERAGQAGLKLQAITTDDTQLHVYLTTLE